ncbi:T6SS phospholipase effector Tle1-like catalytic domain-containing protein [Pseudomonas juntendi]|uniref:phospholipase effector Tle1 domain-containing protein n=1 Tax=Pseudomonas juntendi TaxID=2666183 RepID=UPI001B82E8E8|nr:DUF2235 domain-containing protein [Pseudomonas juntendi]MBR7523346.1 DUF2235 domain-containing protein [Pseudomonas juntendi]
MSKYIFVFLDGTGNKPGQTDVSPQDGGLKLVESNTLKLWRMLTRSRDDYITEQLAGDLLYKYYGIVKSAYADSGCIGEAIYFNGVGTQGGSLVEKYEGATGTGTSVRIRDAYRFIAEQYEDDCRICIFGFSRGAFAARSLAGSLRVLAFLMSGE